jgi:hypothetical protein
MRHWLKAMGFWTWGLIAVAISVSMVSMSYRMVAVYRSHAILAGPASSAAAGSKVASPEFSGANAPRQPVISRIVAKQLSAANKAMQTGQWTEALDYLRGVEEKAPLTASDRKSIEEIRAYSNIKLGNFLAAQAAYETALAQGAYRAEELVRIFRVLFQLAAVNRQSSKAIEYGERAYEVGALKSNDLLSMSQLHYLQGDCRNSIAWGDKAIASYKEEGVTPKEVLYQIKLQCASNAGDAAAMVTALYDLVRLTNKTSYWNNLIRLERQEERDDHNLLMIYRVMFDTNAMQADTDYIEMAQLLGDAGLPGEAQAVLEKALRTGIVREDHKERVARLLSAMTTRAESDQKSSPQASAGAASGSKDSGSASSVAEMRGRKHLEEVYVDLGRSLMAQDKLAEARRAFARLNTVPNISPRVLRLWNLYADTNTAAPSAP